MKTAVWISLDTEMIGPRFTGHIGFHANYRLDPGAADFPVKLDGAEHVTVIGNGQRRHIHGPGGRYQIIDSAGAVKQGILRVVVKMYKFAVSHV